MRKCLEKPLWASLILLSGLSIACKERSQFAPYSFSIPSSVIEEAIRNAESAPITEERYDVGPIITTDDGTAADSIPIAMDSKTLVNHVSWNGDDCSITILRHPDENIKRVNGRRGNTYIDNTVELTIRRSDQTVMVNRTITKEAFGSVLEADYYSKVILKYFEFLYVKEDKLAFIAVVNCPDETDDECYSIIVYIDRAGEMSIDRNV